VLHRPAAARGRRERGTAQEPRGVGVVQGVRSERRQIEAKHRVFEIGGLREQESRSWTRNCKGRREKLKRKGRETCVQKWKREKLLLLT